jgi:pilus assembly protein CpaC
VAEVQRTVVNALGINWSAFVNQNMKLGLLTGRGASIVNSTTGNFIQAPQTPNPLNSLGAQFHTNNQASYATVLDALAQEQLATILAEPTLVAASGEEASFLAGGEFPYPVAQGTGTGVTITYQFKQYGINLAFLPVVIDDKIVMRIRIEVSDLDFTQSIQSAGSYIPAVRTRRAETTVEMGNGQSMVLAGLLSELASSAINSMPGLGDLPILGPLFRSNNFQNKLTELVIMVTPYYVDPMDSPQEVSLPTDGLQYANIISMGKLDFAFKGIVP